MSRRVRFPESGKTVPFTPMTGGSLVVSCAGANAPAKDCPLGTSFWELGDGTRIAAVVYSLVDCPPLTSACYILADRCSRGLPVRLAAGRALSAYPSLNLARIRYLGANLGASEVHVVRCDRGGVALARLAESVAVATPVG